MILALMFYYLNPLFCVFCLPPFIEKKKKALQLCENSPCDISTEIRNIYINMKWNVKIQV